MLTFDQTKPVAEQLENQRKQLDDIARMMDSDGWRLYEAYLKSEETRILADLAKASTGEAALRAASAYAVLSGVRTLPLKTVQQGLAQLAQTQQ